MNALRIRLGPLWPYAVLIGLPAAAFILPDLLGGRLVMTGDNLQQNYPLHVLVGSMVRHGQLPFWNPYLFSGTPLLAGFNAGALYPLVGLFVILPDRVAWIATEVILFSLIGVGMYLFLRALTLSTVACVLAALTLMCSGVVLGQANHVDMTEGFASIPFMLLAVLHIVRDGRWRWSVVLGVGFALVIFGGAPEAMLDEALLIAVYAAVSAGFDRARWWRVLTRCGTGAVLALGLAAAQWLPGITAIASSQRSGLGSSFAGSGSFPPTYSLLSLVPYLYGGFGHLGEAMFFSHYNLPEVEIYMGILPVIALLTLWRPQWPSRLGARERMTWYVVGLIGLLLAFGANTPLEHLFNAIPLYGRQRLQSRNMIDLVIATCVLFAGWIDRRGNAKDPSVRFDRRMAFIPFSLVLALAGWGLVAPASLVTTLSSGSGSAAEAHTVREATLIALGVCAAAAVIVWLRPLVRRRRWLLLVSAFTVLDLGLVAGTSGLVTIPSNALVAGTTPIERHVAADLTSGGRFDVFNPQRYGEGPSEAAAGLPDGNVLAQLPSVGGYASIVNEAYNAHTLTHEQGQLNIARLATGDLDGLDLQAIVTAPEYFLLPLHGTPTTLREVSQVTEAPGTDPVLPLGIRADVPDGGYRAYPAPRAELGIGQSSTWFFGASLHPLQASVLLTTPSPAGVRIRFGTVHANGSTTWGTPAMVVGGATSAAGPLPSGAGPAGASASATSASAASAAVGLAVQVISGRLPPHQATITVGARTYELDGSLSDVVRPGLWRLSGSFDDFALFARTAAPHPLYAVPRAGRPSPKISVVSDAANTETVRVRATAPTVVVRDVARDAGWSASVSVNGRPGRPVHVAPHGLTQEVRLPAGADLVTFTYRPPHWLVASSLTAGSFLLLVVLVVAALIRRGSRSRRGGRRHDHDGRGPWDEEDSPPRVRAAPDAAPAPSMPSPRPVEPAPDPYVVSSKGGPA